MVHVMKLKGALLAAALATAALPAALANSVASCTFNANAGGSAAGDPVLFEAVGSLAVRVCDGVADPPADIEDSVSAVARAVASQVVNITGGCYASGRASFTVNGAGYAEFTARSILKTVGQIFIEAEVCEKCSAVAELVVENIQVAIATAVGNAEIDLQGLIDDDASSASAGALAAGDRAATSAEKSADGNSIEARATAFTESVVEATVTGVVSAVVLAEADALTGCLVSANLTVADEDGTILATCEVSPLAVFDQTDLVESFDVLIMAGADFCAAFEQPKVLATIEVALNAVAGAIADVVGACEASDPNSAACARGLADVNVISTTVVKLFIEAVFTKGGCIPDECFSGDDPLVSLQEAFVEVTSSVFASALADGCVEGEGITDFEAFAEASLNAAVEAVFKVVIDTSDVINTCIDGVSTEVESVEEVPAPQIPTAPPIEDPVTTIPPVLLPVPPPFPPPTITAAPPPAPPTDTSNCASACMGTFRRCAGGFSDGVAPCCQPADGTVFQCKKLGRGSSGSAFCRPSDDVFYTGEILPCTPAATPDHNSNDNDSD